MRDWSEAIRQRLAAARLDAAAEAEIVEELSQHLDDRFQELRALGMSEAEAERLALDELEDEATLAPRMRRTRPHASPPPVPIGAEPRAGGLSSLWSDFRFGARLLRRSPGFAVISILVIALGIGANAAIFSVVNAVLLRPTPGVRDPGRLAEVFTSDFSGPRFGASSYPDFAAIRDARVFESTAVYTVRMLSVGAGDWSGRLLGEVVSGEYFGLLGVRPALGRFFLPEEMRAAGSSTSVVISHGFWLDRFGGARDVLGKPLRVNGQQLTIVGVAPEAFRGSIRGVRMDVWLPVTVLTAVADVDLAQRGDRGLFIVGRLSPGGSVEAAQARLNVVARQLHAAYGDWWTDVNEQPRVLTVVPEAEARVPRSMRGAVLGLFALLMTVVGIVLLIACTNVANLMLTRAAARQAEMGIRLALGATRARVVRHVLAETMLLAVSGGALGVLLAFWLTRSINVLPLPVPIPFALDVALDLRVLAFAAAITMATGLLFGLAPALHASRAPAPLMKRQTAAGAPRLRLRNALVVVQVAASLVLLLGGGLFLRSILAAQRVDVGFDPENMALVSFDLSREGYSQERAARHYAEYVERVSALPGVHAVTLAERVPLGAGWGRRFIGVEGYTPQPGEDMEVPFNGVGPEYFRTMGIRLLRGRDFAATDRAGAPPVVIVNESFARRFWPGQNPLGKGVRMGGPERPVAEVVGVAADGKYRSLTEEPTPYFYYPYLQSPSPAMTVQVRTADSPTQLAPALRREAAALAPGIPPPTIVTLRRHMNFATLPQRIAAAMLGVLGGLALAISLLGLYGVVAYAALRRTREFGIRVALGALSSQVQRMVIADGLRLAAIGIAIGLAIALVLAYVVRGMLLVSPFDPVALLVAPLLLAAAAALASYVPARRATRVDPLVALRSE